MDRSRTKDAEIQDLRKSESLAESLGNRDQGSTVKISKPYICKDAEHDVDTLAHSLTRTHPSLTNFLAPGTRFKP